MMGGEVLRRERGDGEGKTGRGEADDDNVCGDQTHVLT
jgi:hypothetical protein